MVCSSVIQLLLCTKALRRQCWRRLEERLTLAISTPEQIRLLYPFFLRTWHKSEEMKMSWSRFILQRGFDCHVRVIDCSKDRGKSRNVITVLLRSVPPLRQSMRSKKGILICAQQKTVA
jgi:hypothetical protein